MDEIRISLDTTGNENEISIVRVDGVIDTMTASELEKVMNKLLEQSRYNIIIDLGGVDYISSAGWGIFISNIREIRQHSGDLKLAKMIPNVYEIYELLEFDSILPAFDNVERARSDFNLEDYNAESAANNPGSSVATEVLEEKKVKTEKIEKPADPANIAKEEPREKPLSAGKSDEERVLALATDDPFLSIREMKKILNTQADGQNKLGWWRIRKILKKSDLLSKKKRFRYARDH